MLNQIGCDVFLEDVGKHDKFNCPVCGSFCTVNRNSGVKFIKSHCDIFYCPNGGKSWHYKVSTLKNFIENVPSKQLNDLVEQDIKQLLSKKG